MDTNPNITKQQSSEAESPQKHAGTAAVLIVSLVISFLVCWVICFEYFRNFTGFSAWLSGLLAIPVVLIFLAVILKMAIWSDGTGKQP